MKISGVSSISEPDDFAVGTDLTNAFKGITLSVEDNPEKSVVVADGFSSLLGEDFASTGTRVFGTDPPHPDVTQGWDEASGLLRVDFAQGTDFVQIDLSSDNGDSGELSAFNANNQLIDSAQFDSAGIEIESPSVSSDDAQIAYVTVGGIQSDALWLDNLHFGVVGSSGADRMVGTKGDDHYNGLDGNDRIDGRDGNDTLLGGPGSDTIRGGLGFNVIDGGTGDDIILGANGASTKLGGFSFIDGGAGNDTLSYETSPLRVEIIPESVPDENGIPTHGIGISYVGGFFEPQWIDSFLGIETVIGSKHDDFLIFAPNLFGGKGDDVLDSGGQLSGGTGNDTLVTQVEGGFGADLTGGKGEDTFWLQYFGFFDGQSSVIHDFRKGHDLLVLDGGDDNPSLTNGGDIWTVHFENFDGTLGEQSFQIVGVTSLDTSDFLFI